MHTKVLYTSICRRCICSSKFAQVSMESPRCKTGTLRKLCTFSSSRGTSQRYAPPRQASEFGLELKRRPVRRAVDFTRQSYVQIQFEYRSLEAIAFLL